MPEKFTATITINAKPVNVWTTLTDLQLMPQWMGDAEMNIMVQTDWKTGSPIFIRGFHHINFENKGTVLEYSKEKRLSYTHLSSLSKLEDKQENYSILEFVLTPVEKQTQLTISIENFPNEVIQKHLEFYWRATIFSIKEKTEDISMIR
ncbi:MAG: SRPBCC family protein [Sphingobacteriaceae bacterium]